MISLPKSFLKSFALGIMAFVIFGGASCSKDFSLFQSIGTEFASPISVAVDTATNRAYVVNSNTNFNFTNTTLSILDITDPINPALLNNAANPISIPNFSSQIFYDPATQTAFVPNRESDDADDDEDVLLKINLNEADGAFGTVTEIAGGENPFGIACCDGQGRIYVVSTAGTLNVFDPADLSTSVELSLQVTLSTGEVFSGASSSEVVFIGNQAFITNQAGRIYVINTDEVGDTTKNPIDYILIKGGFFRGIATDGTSLFVVDANPLTPILRVIDPSTLTAISPDVSTTTEIDVATVQVGNIAVGEDPNEVTIFNNRAYVSNFDDDNISVIDVTTTTPAAITTITVGDQPFGLTQFSSGGSDLLYVTNMGSNTLSIIDLSNNTVVKTFAP